MSDPLPTSISVSMNSEHETEVPSPDRRRNPSVQVVNQQPAALGLTGYFGQFANLSATVIIAGLAIMQYQFITASSRRSEDMFREEMKLMRAEINTQREADTRKNELLGDKLQVLAQQLSTLAMTNQMVLSEMRASRTAITEAERTIKAATPPPPEPESRRPEAGATSPRPSGG